MGKGRVKKKAAKLHDPKAGDLYNLGIAVGGHYSIDLVPEHVRLALTIEALGDVPAAKPLKKTLASLMMEATAKHDAAFFRGLADCMEYINSGDFESVADPMRSRMLWFYMWAPIRMKDPAYLPTKKELSDFLGCDERQVKRMADEMGKSFRSSKDKRQNADAFKMLDIAVERNRKKGWVKKTPQGEDT